MPKETPFFKFDAESWLGGSIQFTSLECKGLFIDLCALYWECQKPLQIDTKLKVRTRCVEGTLTDLIGTLSDLGILDVSEAGITVPFLDKLMADREQWLKKCSEAGKKSGSLKGTSSNKKEERRKKKEESREKNVDNTPNPPEGANFKKLSSDEFKKEVWKAGEGKYSVDMLKAFFEYWTEPDERGKMRFQREKTWSIAGRLSRWASNNFNSVSGGKKAFDPFAAFELEKYNGQ